MARTVKSALLQATYSGDKKSMVDKHLGYVEQARRQGAQILCFQEVFNGPYFCQVQDARWYESAEPIPGPTMAAFQDAARQHGLVLVVPIYERVGSGTYYNTTGIVDADGKLLGIYRKTHIPQLPGFWEKFYFKPGNVGYPVFKTALNVTVGTYTCYDRHFPEGARALGLAGAEIVYIPSATARSLSMHLWFIEQRAHAIANGYFVGTINRVGVEPEFGPQEYYGSSYHCDPRGNILTQASDKEEQLIVDDINLDLIKDVRDTWQFYRDRRPDAYGPLVEALP
ncbi:MAG: nitrilase-related carbon-nitrogen hydrolase [Chloroflexota bacterium]